MAITDWLTYYRALLRSRGHSQADLAKYLQLSESQTSRLLKGVSKATVADARKMAEFLQLELTELLDPKHHHVVSDKYELEAAQIIGRMKPNQRRLALAILRTMEKN